MTGVYPIWSDWKLAGHSCLDRPRGAWVHFVFYLICAINTKIKKCGVNIKILHHYYGELTVISTSSGEGSFEVSFNTLIAFFFYTWIHVHISDPYVSALLMNNHLTHFLKSAINIMEISVFFFFFCDINMYGVCWTVFFNIGVKVLIVCFNCCSIGSWVTCSLLAHVFFD